jgi:hypothetical protein
MPAFYMNTKFKIPLSFVGFFVFDLQSCENQRAPFGVLGDPMVLVRIPDYQADKIVNATPSAIESIIHSYVNKTPLSCAEMVELIEILTIAKVFTQEGKSNAA